MRPSSRLRFALTLWVYGVEPLSKMAGEEAASQAVVGLASQAVVGVASQAKVGVARQAVVGVARQAEVGVASQVVVGVASQAEEVDAVVHSTMRASLGVVAGGLLRLERDGSGLCRWVMHESAQDGAQEGSQDSANEGAHDVAVSLQESPPWIGADTWYYHCDCMLIESLIRRARPGLVPTLGTTTVIAC